MSAMRSPAGLTAFARKLVGQPYWYGTCCWLCTESMLNGKAGQYPKHYTASRMPRYRQDIANKRVACDCVGLIKGYGWRKPDGAIGYAINGVPDVSANQMYNAAKIKGNIATIPRHTPGLAVRFDGHIGVYIGSGDVVEARGFAHGVVVTKLASRPWTHWLEVPWLSYGSAPGATKPAYPLGFGERVLKQGMTGEDVRRLQGALIALGFTVGIWGTDGDFGPATKLAVVAYQYSKRLTQDGIVGDATRAAMEADLPDQYETDDRDAEKEQNPYARTVRVTGGSVFIRLMPSVELGQIISVAKEGEEYTYAGETADNGWLSVAIDEEIGWVSGKYALLL